MSLVPADLFWVWTLIGVILLAVIYFVLAKYTGFGEFLGNILSLFNTLVGAAPTFFKIMIFLLLFWLFGTTFYNYTVGFKYACTGQGVVMEANSIGEGMVASFMPEKLDELNFEGADPVAASLSSLAKYNQYEANSSAYSGSTSNIDVNSFYKSEAVPPNLVVERRPQDKLYEVIPRIFYPEERTRWNDATTTAIFLCR